MNRVLIITADTHAGLPTAEYRNYLPKRFHADLNDFLAHRQVANESGVSFGSGGRGFAIFNEEFLQEFLHFEAVATGGAHGGWDMDRRRKELEADGIVAEVIFPGPVALDTECSIPFQGCAFFGDQHTVDYPFDSAWAGARAYNLWLAEVLDPVRQAGLAYIPTLADIDQALEELHTAAKAGFRGVLIRAFEQDVPPLYNDRYEPFWKTMVDLNLALHFHAGVGRPTPPQFDDIASLVESFETHFWTTRPLGQLIYSGVLARNPGLRVVFTETSASWAPNLIAMLDARYDEGYLKYKDVLPRRPSEYWKEQCFIGASFLTRGEMAMREQIGLNSLMFGTDYPHCEGTWPETRGFLNVVMEGCPEADVRLVLGENAARCYGFDVATLLPIVERVGPTIEELTRPAVDQVPPLSGRNQVKATRSTAYAQGGVVRGG